MRTPGDGSIYRARGAWRISLTLGWQPDGRPIRRYGTAKTEAEAKNLLRVWLTERDAGLLRPGQAPTVAAWMTTWLTTIAVHRVKPRTLIGYESMNRLWITPVLGRHRLDKLAPEHVEQLHTAMRAGGLAPASCLRAHRILARALRVAEQRGHVRRNVAALVDAPSAEHTERDFLLLSEILAIIDAARGDRMEARWAIALGCGLRQGETLALTWPDIDLDRGLLVVHRTMTRLPRVGLVMSAPKTAASQAAVALPPPIVDMLRAHRVRQSIERLEDGPNWTPWHGLELVFAQRSGNPIDPRRDGRDWKRLCVRAGVRLTPAGDDYVRVTSTARLHDARHATATVMRLLGESTKVIQATLRHASPAITAHLYEHVLPEVQTAASDRLGDRMFGGSS